MTDILTSSGLSSFDPSKFCQRRKDQTDCNQVNSELLKYEIRPDSEYSEMQYHLKYKGVGCLALGELVGFSGKAKAGKGLALIAMSVALLKGEWGGFKAEKNNTKVLFIDNEQTGFSAQNNLRKIYSLCGWASKIKNPRIDYYCLRDADIKTRRTVLESALIERTPDVVFVDNVRDLLKDFNSIDESGELVNFLMRLTKQYSVTIITVLHENKGKDENLRGHLGTEIVIKASEVYHVTKTVDNFKVVQTECRNAPIDDWSFELDEQNCPVPDTKVDKGVLQKAIFRNEFRLVFEETVSYNYTGLVEAVQKYMLVSVAEAKRRIKDARLLGILKTENKFISFKNEGAETVPNDTPG